MGHTIVEYGVDKGATTATIEGSGGTWRMMESDIQWGTHKKMSQSWLLSNYYYYYYLHHSIIIGTYREYYIIIKITQTFSHCDR